MEAPHRWRPDHDWEAARRRQEIPEEDRITGRLPKGKIVSLSHCWDATCNCDPTGKKMAELQLALEELGATGDEDAVFIDYCSLPQMAPRHAPAHLTRDVVLPQRTNEETKRFLFALTEMSRECNAVSLVRVPQLIVTLACTMGSSTSHRKPLMCS